MYIIKHNEVGQQLSYPMREIDYHTIDKGLDCITFCPDEMKEVNQDNYMKLKLAARRTHRLIKDYSRYYKTTGERIENAY